jgi:hypothetical protein
MARPDEQPYIFLDPDGTQDFGLVVIVAAATGVTYAHQCGGLATILCEMEGFAVPLGGPMASEPLRAFFHRRFRGNPPMLSRDLESLPGAQWTPEALEELSGLVEQIAFWKTHSDASGKDDEPHHLRLDRARIGELTEAWVPVSTVYGPGVLVFANSD